MQLSNLDLGLFHGLMSMYGLERSGESSLWNGIVVSKAKPGFIRGPFITEGPSELRLVSITAPFSIALHRKSPNYSKSSPQCIFSSINPIDSGCPDHEIPAP